MLQTQINPYESQIDLYKGWDWPSYGYTPPGGFTVYPDYGRSQPIVIGQQRKQQGQNPMQMYDMYNQFSNMFGGGEGSFGGVASDPSTYNIDYGGGSGGGFFDSFTNWFGGSGATEGGSSVGGIGGGALAGWLALIAAASIGQDKAAGNIERTFEGQEAGSALSGHFLTEPWYAKLTEGWGWDITAGEKFDAAAKNGDWGTALRRLPEAANYWVNPFDTYIGDFAKNQWGPLAEGLFNPTGLITSWFD